MKTILIGTSILLISALMYGCSNNDEMSTAMDSDLQTQFQWGDIEIPLETDNDWSVTRFNNSLALTDYRGRRQFVFQWSGDSSDGIKEEVQMTVLEVGKELSHPKVEEFHVRGVNGTHYIFTFLADNLPGCVTISM